MECLYPPPPMSQALQPPDLPPGAQCTHCPPPRAVSVPTGCSHPLSREDPWPWSGLLFFARMSEIWQEVRAAPRPRPCARPHSLTSHLLAAAAGSARAPEPSGPNAQQSGPSPSLCLNLRLGHGRRPAPQPPRPTYSPSCSIPTQSACSRLSPQSSWDLSGMRSSLARGLQCDAPQH